MEFNNYFILGWYRTWYRPGYCGRTRGSSGGKKPGCKIRYYFHDAFGAGGSGDHRSLWSACCNAVDVR